MCGMTLVGKSWSLRPGVWHPLSELVKNLKHLKKHEKTISRRKLKTSENGSSNIFQSPFGLLGEFWTRAILMRGTPRWLRAAQGGAMSQWHTQPKPQVNKSHWHRNSEDRFRSDVGHVSFVFLWVPDSFSQASWKSRAYSFRYCFEDLPRQRQLSWAPSTSQDLPILHLEVSSHTLSISSSSDSSKVGTLQGHDRQAIVRQWCFGPFRANPTVLLPVVRSALCGYWINKSTS